VAAEHDRLERARPRDPDRKLVVQPDPRDRYDERIRFDAALQELTKLPPALQRVVLIRSQMPGSFEVVGRRRARMASCGVGDRGLSDG
jgi:hypothetical protein